MAYPLFPQGGPGPLYLPFLLCTGHGPFFHWLFILLKFWGHLLAAFSDSQIRIPKMLGGMFV